MPRTTSPARVEAFFRALGETGNQTIAAERARVSRSWVYLRRTTDPAFAARVAAVLAGARERLRAARSTVPATGWRTYGHEEMIVRGGNARWLQVRRARLDEWTPRIEARFLAALSACCSVVMACRTAGKSVSSAYTYYRRSADFAKRWDAALATGYDRLEMALLENAQRSLGVVADYPPDIPIQPMTFDDALRLLRLHTTRVRGGRPRRGADPRGPMSDAEVTAELLKRFAAKRRALAAAAERAG